MTGSETRADGTAAPVSSSRTARDGCRTHCGRPSGITGGGRLGILGGERVFLDVGAGTSGTGASRSAGASTSAANLIEGGADPLGTSKSISSPSNRAADAGLKYTLHSIVTVRVVGQ